MHLRIVPLLLAALCGVLATAIAVAADDRPAEEIRTCGTRGDSNKPQQLPKPPGVRIGPIVIWPSVRTRLDTYGEPWPYYVKAPVVVPARVKAVLAVAPEALHLAAFQSGRRPSTWLSSVRFEACREREPAFPGAYRGTVGKYTGFPFGFGLARRSACVPLEVWVDGADAPIRRLVPFGRRSCP